MSLLAPLRASGQIVPLVLHNLVISVDSATFHDIGASPFLRGDFAATETGLFLLGADGGQGIQLMGKFNFLQITERPAGNAVTGIVLASEHADGLTKLRQQGPFAGGKTAYVTNDDLQFGPRHPYWMGAARIRPAAADSLSPQVDVEILQYTHATADSLARIDSIPSSNLAVHRFLAPYFDPHKLLAYVSSATLAIPVDDIKHIVAVLQRDEIKVTPEGEGAVIDLGGITIRLIPPWSGAGVKQLTFALTSDVPANPVYRFGPKSQLRFGPGPMAVWDFGPR
jgi:hypothetical protein